MRATEAVVAALVIAGTSGCLGGDHRLGSVSGETGGSEGTLDDGSSEGDAADGDGSSGGTDAGATTVDPFAGAEVVKAYVDGLSAASAGVWSPTRVRLLVTDPGADMILAAQPMSFAPLYMPSGGAVALVEAGGEAILVAEADTGRLVSRDGDATTVLREGLVSVRALARSHAGDVYVVHDAAAGSTAIAQLRADGGWTEALDGLPAVMGLGFMPSGEALVAVVPGSGELLRLPVDPEGVPGAPETFATVDDATGAVCFDDHGNTIVGAGTGLVALAADGTAWEGLEVGAPVLACSFGGYDRRTLYLVGTTAIQTVRLAVTGQP